MRLKSLTVCSLAALFASAVFAQEAAPAPAEAAEVPQVNEELEAEIAYVEALVSNGYPDFAEPIIVETKKKWPESDVRFFAIEIEGLILMNKMEEAEKKIAALPDRKGPKYWAARLKLANNYNVRNKKTECRQIYSEFFETHKTPTKELLTFYLEASYAWGQILVADKRYAEAAEAYERLLAQKLKPNEWCMVACEAIDIYTRLASDEKDKKKLAGYLDNAEKLADKILNDYGDQVLYFGRAVSMKAHIVLLRGNIQEAQDIIEEFLPMLEELHENIVSFDANGKLGLRKQSPLPQCRYLLAEMLWKEAQNQFAQPKHDDDQIKDLMFGAKLPSGKRNGNGAYNHALNVFISYPECSWAPKAGELSDEIENFAIEKYQAKIQKKVTPEMIARVLQAQFQEAKDKIDEGDYQAGIDAYFQLLGQYPETMNSIQAIEQIVKAYHVLMQQTKDEAKKNELRIDCDTVEHYIAERFSGIKDKKMMTEAGNATLRIAAVEQEVGQPGRAEELKKAFVNNYTRHSNAAQTGATLAGEAMKAGRWADAIAMYDVIANQYSNSTYYVTSFYQRSTCYGKLGERAEEIALMKKYIELETNPVTRFGCQMVLAQMYQKDGFDMLKAADEIEDEAEQNKMIAKGCASIVRGIQQFREFTGKIDELLNDPNVPAPDKEKYVNYKEAAIFLIGESWSRMKKPAAKLDTFRKNAAEGYEAYVAAYPNGEYTKKTYVKLSMIYTSLNEMEKSKSALDRLTKAFPDSEEAKNAKPALAKSLIEMGLKKEGTEIYAEMLKTNGAYQPVQFVNAGEALIEAKSWDYASQAFEKAIRMSGTNQQSVVARAHIGQANALFRQKRYAEAREALDTFLANEKMARMVIAADANFLLVKVASEMGRNEKDATMRQKHFGAAVGAVRKVKNYWKNKPQSDQDMIDLMAVDIMVDRMKSEEAMDLKEEALETCGKAAALLQAFMQAHCVCEARPLDKMTPGELANLERCYVTMIPLFSKMGAEQADRVLKYGQEYLDLFPNGRNRTEISNYMNQAHAEGVKK